jgi:hydroxylamine reductase (hybrid-cluster protein)
MLPPISTVIKMNPDVNSIADPAAQANHVHEEISVNSNDAKGPTEQPKSIPDKKQTQKSDRASRYEKRQQKSDVAMVGDMNGDEDDELMQKALRQSKEEYEKS